MRRHGTVAVAGKLKDDHSDADFVIDRVVESQHFEQHFWTGSLLPR